MDNASFWNDRYYRFPRIGSGPGSRGWAGWYKNRIIKETIAEFDIKSIIDIGCGDLCWLDPIILQKCDYTGYDISSVAIQQARTTYPSLRFFEHDVTISPIVGDADLIVCFDLLIHQIRSEAFRGALENTLASVRSFGLLSYRTPPGPDGGFPPPTTFDATMLDRTILKRERELRDFLADNDSTPIAATAFHAPLPVAVRALRGDLKVTAVGCYRHQTVYAIQ